MTQLQQRKRKQHISTNDLPHLIGVILTEYFMFITDANGIRFYPPQTLVLIYFLKQYNKSSM